MDVRGLVDRAVLGLGHDHAAAADPQVQRLVQVAVLLFQHVAAGDPQIRGAVLDVRGTSVSRTISTRRPCTIGMISRRPARALSAAPRSMPALANSGSASSRMRPRGSATSIPGGGRRRRLGTFGLHASLARGGRRRPAAQLLLDALVAAIQVVDAQHLRLAAATSPASTRQARRAGRSPSPSRPSAWPGRARWPCGPDDDVGAHAQQLGHVHEAVLEDVLGDDRLPLRAGISTMNCACMSVGKPG